MALAVGRRVPEHRHAGRGRVVGRLAADLRGAPAPRPGPLAGRAAALPHEPEGDAADGRRAPVHQHADLAGRVDRRRDRRDALGLQPEDVRRGYHDDERALEPARGGVLVRRTGTRGRAHPLRDRQRLPDLRRRQDRPAVPRLRGGRLDRSDRGPPASRPQRPRLAERVALLGAVAAARRRRHHRHAVLHLVLQHHEGSAARLDARVRPTDRAHQVDVPHDPAGGRVRQRHVGGRFMARDGEGRRLVVHERRSRAGADLPADQYTGARLLRRPTGSATTCSPRASSPSTSRPGSANGTSRRSTTASGTGTFRRRPTWSTSWSTAGR